MVLPAGDAVPPLPANPRLPRGAQHWRCSPLALEVTHVTSSHVCSATARPVTGAWLQGGQESPSFTYWEVGGNSGHCLTNVCSVGLLVPGQAARECPAGYCSVLPGMANTHELGGLEPHQFIILQFWRPEAQNGSPRLGPRHHRSHVPSTFPASAGCARPPLRLCPSCLPRIRTL